MNIAERLYTAGLLSYPRTESSAYPKGFDFRAILRDHQRNPIWGEYVSALVSAGINEPKVRPWRPYLDTLVALKRAFSRLIHVLPFRLTG